MFDFLKRSFRSNSSIDDADDGDDDCIKTATGFVAAESSRVATKKAAQHFSKPKQYNRDVRKLYDDGRAKEAVKRNAFKDGKAVRDPYTGKKLELKHSDAKLKYGDKWVWHASEADHITPIEKVFNQNKNNPWVDNDDLKRIINSKENLEPVSKKFNTTKKESTNKRMLSNKETAKKLNMTDKQIDKAVKKGQASEKFIKKEIRKSSVKNAAQTGHNAGKSVAKDSGITALTMSGIMNLTSVIRGEKTAEEAISDTIMDGGKAAVTGYVTGGGLTVLSHSLSNSSSQFIQALTESSVPGHVITAVVLIGDTLKRYGDGEISTQECMIELGEKGLNFATTGYAMTIGQTLIPIPVVGAAVGALVGSMITSTYYNQLITALKTKEFENHERMRIIDECEKAAREARKFREELEAYLQHYFADYQHCFDEALNMIYSAFQAQDAEGIIAGANQITSKLGGSVYFNTVDEFEDFLLSDTVDKF